MFKCFKCAKCCKNVVFHNIEKRKANEYAEKAGVDPKIITKWRHSLEYNAVVGGRDFYYLEGECPFNVKGCLIYDMRPINCRRFMCGRTDEKEAVVWQGRRCINTELHYKEDSEFKKQAQENMIQANKWAKEQGVI